MLIKNTSMNDKEELLTIPSILSLLNLQCLVESQYLSNQ